MLREEKASTSKVIGILPLLLTSNIVVTISPFITALSEANANGPRGLPESENISVTKSSLARTSTDTVLEILKEGSLTDSVTHVTSSTLPAAGSPFGNFGTRIFIGRVVYSNLPMGSVRSSED